LLFLILIIFTGCDLKSANDYLKEAGGLEDKEKYSEAIKLLNKAIDSYPEFKDVYLSRGADRAALGNYTGAIDDYSSALKLDPKNTLALFNIGNNYKRLHQELKAIAYYNSALKTKGNDFVSMDIKPNPFIESAFDVPFGQISYERGLAFFRIDSLKHAFSDFRNAIDGGYKADKGFYYEGLILKCYRQKVKACECFVKAGQLGNKDAIKEFDSFCQGN